MKKTITFITGNKGKFKEIKAMIPELKNKDIDLPEIQEIDGKKVIEAKLKEAYKTFKQEFIVEDTSLHLNCLNDLPGPLIKWFLKTIGVSGIYDLAKKYNNFKTEAICWIGYIDKKGKITFFGLKNYLKDN